MTDEEFSLDNVDPVHGKRISNRIGLQEVDEDGWVWLSHGKVYSCTGAAYSEEKEDVQ
jgi:hypothetical protein